MSDVSSTESIVALESPRVRHPSQLVPVSAELPRCIEERVVEGNTGTPPVAVQTAGVLENSDRIARVAARDAFWRSRAVPTAREAPPLVPQPASRTLRSVAAQVLPECERSMVHNVGEPAKPQGPVRSRYHRDATASWIAHLRSCADHEAEHRPPPCATVGLGDANRDVDEPSQPIDRFLPRQLAGGSEYVAPPSFSTRLVTFSKEIIASSLVFFTALLSSVKNVTVGEQGWLSRTEPEARDVQLRVRFGLLDPDKADQGLVSLLRPRILSWLLWTFTRCPDSVQGWILRMLSAPTIENACIEYSWRMELFAAFAAHSLVRASLPALATPRDVGVIHIMSLVYWLMPEDMAEVFAETVAPVIDLKVARKDRTWQTLSTRFVFYLFQELDEYNGTRLLPATLYGIARMALTASRRGNADAVDIYNKAYSGGIYNINVGGVDGCEKMIAAPANLISEAGLLGFTAGIIIGYLSFGDFHATSDTSVAPPEPRKVSSPAAVEEEEVQPEASTSVMTIDQVRPESRPAASGPIRGGKAPKMFRNQAKPAGFNYDIWAMMCEYENDPETLRRLREERFDEEDERLMNMMESAHDPSGGSFRYYPEAKYTPEAFVNGTNFFVCPTMWGVHYTSPFGAVQTQAVACSLVVGSKKVTGVLLPPDFLGFPGPDGKPVGMRRHVYSLLAREGGIPIILTRLSEKPFNYNVQLKSCYIRSMPTNELGFVVFCSCPVPGVKLEIANSYETVSRGRSAIVASLNTKGEQVMANTTIVPSVNAFARHHVNTQTGSCGSALLANGFVIGVHVGYQGYQRSSGQTPEVASSIFSANLAVTVFAEQFVPMVVYDVPSEVATTPVQPQAGLHCIPPFVTDEDLLARIEVAQAAVPMPAGIEFLSRYQPPFPFKTMVSRPDKRQKHTIFADTSGTLEEKGCATIYAPMASLLTEQFGVKPIARPESMSLIVPTMRAEFSIMMDRFKGWIKLIPHVMSSSERWAAYMVAFVRTASNTTDTYWCAQFGVRLAKGVRATKRVFVQAMMDDAVLRMKVFEYLDVLMRVANSDPCALDGSPIYLFEKREAVAVKKLLEGRTRVIGCPSYGIQILVMTYCSFRSANEVLKLPVEECDEEAWYAWATSAPVRTVDDFMSELRFVRSGGRFSWFFGGDVPRELAQISARIKQSVDGDVVQWDGSLEDVVMIEVYRLFMGDFNISESVCRSCNSTGTYVLQGQVLRKAGYWRWLSGQFITLSGNSFIHHCMLKFFGFEGIVMGDDLNVLNASPEEVRAAYARFGLRLKQAELVEGLSFCKIHSVDGCNEINLMSIFRKMFLNETIYKSAVDEVLASHDFAPSDEVVEFLRSIEWE